MSRPSERELAPPRPDPPPPLEANDQRVTGIITVGWAIAAVVLLIVRTDIPPNERWWVWTAVTGFAMGLFALWYVPRLKRGRARSAQRHTEARQAGTDQPGEGG